MRPWAWVAIGMGAAFTAAALMQERAPSCPGQPIVVAGPGCEHTEQELRVCRADTLGASARSMDAARKLVYKEMKIEADTCTQLGQCLDAAATLTLYDIEQNFYSYGTYTGCRLTKGGKVKKYNTSEAQQLVRLCKEGRL